MATPVKPNTPETGGKDPKKEERHSGQEKNQPGKERAGGKDTGKDTGSKGR